MSEERVIFLFYEFDKNINIMDSKESIHQNINVLISQIGKIHVDKQLKWITNLILLTIKKRAIRLKYGEGMRLKSYWLIIHLYSYFPKSIYYILRELPYIGSWVDLNNIYGMVFKELDILEKTPSQTDVIKGKIKTARNLLDNIVDVWCLQMDKDKTIMNKTVRTPLNTISFMGKWLPRESGSLNKHTKVVNHILKKYDPLLWSKNRNKTKSIYRKFLTKCNRILNTTEVLMSDRNFSCIDFSQVPSKCLYKYHCAWLDETGHGIRRHPNDIDRNITRHNYSEYINTIVNDGSGTGDNNIILKNKNVLDILMGKAYNPYRHLIKHTNEVQEYYNKINIPPHYNGNYLQNFIQGD